MALFLSIIIIFTVIVKSVTHLFTLGYIPSPILANLLPNEGVIPSMEDDFGVALLKLGTACIEATQYSGLRNELIAVEERQGPWIEINAGSSDVFKGPRTHGGGFVTEITDIEVTELQDPHVETQYWREWRAFWYACGVSLVLLIGSAILATPVGRRCADSVNRTWESRWWYGPRHWRFWRREAWREPEQFRRRAELRQLQDYAQRYLRLRPSQHSEQSTAVTTAVQLREDAPAPVEWRAILRGEVDVDDDEEDWQDDASSASSGSLLSDDGEEDHNIYRDLMAPSDQASQDDLQPVLLAHLTNSSTPLTRRRYAAILSSPSRPATPSALADVIHDRRLAMQSKDRDEWDNDRRRCCVVCTIEPRDTIFWPCRCLAVCNDCRESLATRLSAKDHMCP